jgi:hypothetical protein
MFFFFDRKINSPRIAGVCRKPSPGVRVRLDFGHGDTAPFQFFGLHKSVLPHSFGLRINGELFP